MWCDGQTEPPVEYRGPDAAEHLLKSLQEEESKVKGVLTDPKAMRMTREDWLAFRTAETCQVCDKPLEGDSVRSHCHITGEYRGAAHNACNLKLRLNPSIPVVFYNLRGYDSHLLMQAISKMEGRVSCIPNNTSPDNDHLPSLGLSSRDHCNSGRHQSRRWTSLHCR